MATLTKEQVQAIADKIVVENDGLPKADTDANDVALCMEHGARVGKAIMDLQRFLAFTRKQVAHAKEAAEAAATAGNLQFRVSRKGTISLYFLQRFPITLKVEQWDKLFAMKEEYETWKKSDPVTHHKATPARMYRGTLQPALPAVDAKIQYGMSGGQYDEDEVAGKDLTPQEASAIVNAGAAPANVKLVG